jgi:chloride channel 3/4/5
VYTRVAEKEGVYDLAQTVLGHPFLDLDHSVKLVQKTQHLAGELIPPARTMKEITVEVPASGCVSRQVLTEKFEQLKARGLMDAGLVLVQPHRNNTLAGYLAEGELDFGLNILGAEYPSNCSVRLMGMSLMSSQDNVENYDDELDMCAFVDRIPLTISNMAPMEYVIEMFGKLGLRYLIVTEQSTGRVLGVIIKKRVVVWLEGLKHEDHK